MATPHLQPRRPPAGWEAWTAAALAVVFVCFALGGAAGSAPTYDEPVHLAAGYSYWRFHDFRLNPEHPPLVKLLAAATLLADPPWPSAERGGDRSRRELERLWEAARRNIDAQWRLAHELFYGVRDDELERLGAARSLDVDPSAPPAAAEYLHDVDRIWRRARLPMVGFGLVLVVLVHGWARELWGPGGGLLAAAFAATDPNLLAHAPLVTTDVAFAAFAFAAVFCLWRLRRRATLVRLAGLAASLALAVAAKHSALLLLPLLVVLALVPVRPATAQEGGTRLPRRLAWVAAGGLAAWLALWGVYGFRHAAVGGEAGALLDIERSLRRTAAFLELSDRWPAGPPEGEVERVAPVAGLGAAGEVILTAHRLRLVPEAYLVGLAHARLKAVARWSFLRGDISLRGFRDFFPWALLLKTPLVTLLALAAALALLPLALRRGPTQLPAAALFLLAPPALFFLASVLSHLNIGHRHLLPMYPFLWVLCGSLAPAARWTGGRLAAAVAVVVLASSIVFYPPWRPTLVFPHYLAYFNEIAGGPRHGHRSLVDSSLDWGQDLARLARWLRARGIDEPIGLCYFGMADPRYYQIRHLKLPGGYALERGRADFTAVPRPGYVAISATAYEGVYLGPELRSAWRRLLGDAERVGTVGHSIFIYRFGPPEHRAGR